MRSFLGCGGRRLVFAGSCRSFAPSAQIMLIAAIAGSLRYDLVRTNALKMLCTIGFTLVALSVFIVRGQVQWVPGLVLACGTMLGAHYSVKLAIKVSQKALKWFLFIMTLFACGAAMLL